ncbi:MAG: PD40 domain-containing protein [Chloroflexia bacterium]|nr:PD40 domain-containing protein [Chloroflexia bacterium]
MRGRGSMLSAGLLIVMTVAGVLPVAAQEASPAATPAGDDAAGWRVVEERAIAVDGEPVALSPDGQWLAGLGPEREFCVWEVESLDAACDGEGLAIRPESIVWAPDSSAVAFSLNAAIYLIDSDVYVFEVAAGELRNLTDDGLDEVNLIGDDTEGPILIDDVPAWSPDSQSLVFARTRWDPEGRRGTVLARIERDGGEPETLFSVDLNLPFAVYFPIWWLEGDRLLYSVLLPDLDDKRNGLWTAGLDASGARQLLPGDSAAAVPAPWVTDVAPDGRFATAYSRANQGRFAGEGNAFYRLDIETGEPEPVLTGEEPEMRITIPPTLSPDGETLLFAVAGSGDVVLAAQNIKRGATSVLTGAIELRGDGTLFGGLDWAENDTVLIPFGDASMLLTLEAVDAD